MAASFSTSFGNSMLDYLTSLIDSGTGSNGTIEFLDNSSNVLCTVNLNVPSFNSASSKQITINNTNPVVGIITQNGTPTTARIKNKSGSIVRDGYTVGVGEGYDFNVDSTTWQQYGVVIINSLTIGIT